MDWVFPLLAAYFVMFAAAVLAASAVLATVRASVSDVMSVGAEDRVVWLDVSTFLVIAIAYMLVMYGLGFWLSSFIMLSLVSLYLTTERTGRNIALAIGTAFLACIVAYVVFELVFYVPLPVAHWWPLAS